MRLSVVTLMGLVALSSGCATRAPKYSAYKLDAGYQTSLPVCYVTVATDTGKAKYVIPHENEHCWGMPGGHAPGKLTKGWKPRGPYPNVKLTREPSVVVQKDCHGDPDGCTHGGLL